MSDPSDDPSVKSFETNDFYDNFEDRPDKQVTELLETLNQTYETINVKEAGLDRIRNQYRQVFQIYQHLLEQELAKNRKAIAKAKDYFTLLADVEKVQSEVQALVTNYQRANSYYVAAKETLYLAEQSLKDNQTRRLTPTWIDVLNHNIEKVRIAEQDCRNAELAHQAKAAELSEMQKQLLKLGKKYETEIKKAQRYYDLRKDLNMRLEPLSIKTKEFEHVLMESKEKRKKVMAQLEEINNEMHEMRRLGQHSCPAGSSGDSLSLSHSPSLSSLPVRTPGVGAESDAESINSLPLTSEALQSHRASLLLMPFPLPSADGHSSADFLLKDRRTRPSLTAPADPPAVSPVALPSPPDALSAPPFRPASASLSFVESASTQFQLVKTRFSTLLHRPNVLGSSNDLRSPSDASAGDDCKTPRASVLHSADAASADWLPWRLGAWTRRALTPPAGGVAPLPLTVSRSTDDLPTAVVQPPLAVPLKPKRFVAKQPASAAADAVAVATATVYASTDTVEQCDSNLSLADAGGSAAPDKHKPAERQLFSSAELSSTSAFF